MQDSDRVYFDSLMVTLFETFSVHDKRREKLAQIFWDYLRDELTIAQFDDAVARCVRDCDEMPTISRLLKGTYQPTYPVFESNVSHPEAPDGTLCTPEENIERIRELLDMIGGDPTQERAQPLPFSETASAKGVEEDKDGLWRFSREIYASAKRGGI